METREATVWDGFTLQQMMKAAMQPAGEMSLTMVTVPDFFGRAAMYPEAAVFVAEEDGALAGSAACAIREVMIGERTHRVGYEFQFFTAPAYRRRGVASQLRARIDGYLVERGVTITTAIAASGNTASRELFRRQGFTSQRNFPLTFVFVTQHTDLRPDMGIRPARLEDLPAILELITRTWAGRDFRAALDLDSLESTLLRVLGSDLDRMLVRVVGGRVVACTGVWEWSDVQQITVNSITPAGRRSFPTFRAGETLRQWGLTLIGYRDPSDLHPLWRHIANCAYAQRVDTIGLVETPGIDQISQIFWLPTADMGATFMVKSSLPGFSIDDRPFAIDIIDI